ASDWPPHPYCSPYPTHQPHPGQPPRSHSMHPHLLAFLALTCLSADKPTVKTLFDFEKEADLKAWSNLVLPDAKTKEPAARWSLSTEHATSGKHSLKITFAGGQWPTITTTQVPADWMPYESFHADVTVSRHCLVGFTVLQEKSQRGGGWDATIS